MFYTQNISESWYAVFEARAADMRAIQRTLPGSMWSPEYCILAAANKIHELEKEIRKLKELE